MAGSLHIVPATAAGSIFRQSMIHLQDLYRRKLLLPSDKAYCKASFTHCYKFMCQ